MVFPKSLEMANFVLAKGVALADGRKFELPGPDIGYIVLEGIPDRFFQGYCLQHGSVSFS